MVAHRRCRALPHPAHLAHLPHPAHLAHPSHPAGPGGLSGSTTPHHGRLSGMKSPDKSPAGGRSGPGAATLPRPMRSDALKNRERLLVAAGHVFEEKGLEASVADVARAAGVGMGTLYRRFPSKKALIEALVTEVLEATIAMAEDAATLPDGTGLEHFLRASSAYQAEHLGCLPKLWQSDHHLVGRRARSSPACSPTRRRTAGCASTSRSTDVSLVLWSIRGVLETTGSNAPAAWKRHLDLLVAGMRPSEAELGHRPLSQNQVDRILSKHEQPSDPRGEPVTTLQEVESGTGPDGATRAHWWILVVIAGAQLMVVLDSTIMIIALPSAQHALGFSNTDRQWVVTAYTLAFGGFLLLGGRISDMFGPKRTLTAGVLGFALASAVGGAAQTTLMLIGARGLQGLFGALLAPSVLSILTSTFTDPARARAGLRDLRHHRHRRIPPSG